MAIVGLVLAAVVTDALDAKIDPESISIAGVALSGIAIILSTISSLG